MVIIGISILGMFSVIYYLNENNIQYFLVQGGKLGVEASTNTNTSIIYQNDLQEMKNIEEVLGHLRIAKIHANNGNSQFTNVHISHAINELQHKQYATKIPQEYLDQLTSLLIMVKSSDKTSIEKFDENIIIITDVINEIKIKSVGEKLMNNPIFQIQTAIYLLELSKSEYALGIQAGNDFENNVEIQDAYAFTLQAQSILKNSMGDKLDSKFDKPSKMIQNVESVKKVEKSVDDVINELSTLLT